MPTKHAQVYTRQKLQVYIKKLQGVICQRLNHYVFL